MRIVVIAALGLSACTSIGEMEAKPPRASYDSAKAADALAKCFVLGVNGLGPPSVIPGADETLVSYQSSGNATLLVSIKKTATGSHVEVRQKLGFFAKPAIERCL